MRKGWTRRELLREAARYGSAAVLGTGALTALRSTWPTPAFAQKSSGKVIIRSLGGAYQEAEKKAIFDPFTAATGIEVVPVPVTAAQVLAMVRTGSVQLDVLDIGETIALSLDKAKALSPIDYGKFKLTNPQDVDSAIRRPTMVGNIYFATVLGYSKKQFASGHPQTWRDFWNVEKFPGPRSLDSIESGGLPLEFALLADGVPMNAIYPIDVTRAFDSLSRIRSHVVKWWTTGAESAELIESAQVVAMDIWNGRIQGPIDKGAPLAIEWNQAMRLKQFWAIVKGAPNSENALRFIDFALQPKPQAELARYIPYGPTNKKAFQYVSAADAANLVSSPQHFARSFDENAYWWAGHLDEVTKLWEKWRLQ